MAQYCQLWMGSLEPFMNETTIMNAFKKMGESPLSVKLIRKWSGELAGYCFVHFASDEEAKTVLHKLNGKIIPGTNDLRFKLNSAGSSSTRPTGQGEFSLWVGDLSIDVDDYALYKCFASRFQTLKTAKVVVDSNGFSKGYGFIRFGSEDEQMRCCVDMNGFKGLGSRPIKVSSAVPKSAAWRKNETPTPTASYDYTSTTAAAGYYDPAAWQSYTAWSQGYYDTAVDTSGVQDYNAQNMTSATEPNDLELIEHEIPIIAEELNAEYLMRDCELWNALESSKWLPVEIA